MLITFVLQSSSSGFASFIPLMLIILVTYFFFIRPQAKKNKEQNTFTSNMKKGDEVVTGSGIIGKINKIDDDSVTLQIDQKTFLRFVKGAISKEMTESYRKSTQADTKAG